MVYFKSRESGMNKLWLIPFQQNSKNHLTKWKYNLNVLEGKSCNLGLFLAFVYSYMFPNTIFCLPLPLCSSGEEENHQQIGGGEEGKEFEEKFKKKEGLKKNQVAIVELL
jgi:hypothetical protein